MTLPSARSTGGGATGLMRRVTTGTCRSRYVAGNFRKEKSVSCPAEVVLNE